MIKDITRLFKIFYGQRKMYASLVGLSLIVLTCSAVGLDVLFNHWRSVFWTAVQAKDLPTAVHQVWVFTALAFTSIGLYTSVSYLGQRYTLEWRKQLCESLLARWTSRAPSDIRIESPDQRVQEDTAKFVSLFNSLFLGLVTAVLTLGMFIPILSSIGTPFIHIFGISGVWWLPAVCVSLSALGFGITGYLGREIPSLENGNQRTEADYRYELVHIRDGNVKDTVKIRQLWAYLYENHIKLFGKSRNFTLGSNCFFQAMVIVPVLCVVPSYFKGLVAFGVIMSVLDAFNKVSTSINWYLDQFLVVAMFKATLTRLVEFDKSLDKS